MDSYCPLLTACLLGTVRTLVMPRLRIWTTTLLQMRICGRLQTELGKFVRIHPEVQALQLTDHEWSTLQQVAKILKPFWDHRLRFKGMPNNCGKSADLLEFGRFAK